MKLALSVGLEDSRHRGSEHSAKQHRVFLHADAGVNRRVTEQHAYWEHVTHSKKPSLYVSTCYATYSVHLPCTCSTITTNACRR